MIRLIGIVVSIGLADSLNPTTIAPALYMATGRHSRVRVTEFTVGVFAVNLIGGLAVALGPGQLLLSLIPHPKHHITHIVEIVAGVAMLIGAAYLWRHRERLGARAVPDFDPKGKSGWVLGATIAAVELPTAFPYFAAIAAVVGSGFDPVRQTVLIVLFNACFVLPLLGIIATLAFAGDRAEKLLTAGRTFLQRHWPVLLSGLAVLAGVFVILLGATGLAMGGHGRFGRIARRFRRIIHP